MSTRLHNGYRVRAATDLLELCEQARAVLDPVRDRLDAAQFATLAATSIDDANAAGTQPPARPLHAAMTAYLNEQSAHDPRYTWQDPHRAALWFARDPHSGDVAMLLMARENAFADALLTVRDVEHYPYWDGTDRPAQISAPEWARRRKFWDRALPTNRYGDARLQWNLRTSVADGVDRIVREHADLAVAHLPTRHERAARLVRDAVLRSTPDIRATEQILTMLRVIAERIAGGQLADAMQAADALVVDVTVGTLTGAADACCADGDVARRRFAEATAGAQVVMAAPAAS